MVGLDELGGDEGFPTEVLAARLAMDGLVKYEAGDEYGGAAPEQARNVRKGGAAKGVGRTESDEDSDFE